MSKRARWTSLKEALSGSNRFVLRLALLAAIVQR
jgi:hypothetical protein